MLSNLFQATGFKRALDLCKEGKHDAAETLMKSLQDEYIAICEENEALKKQLTEVAEVLDLADKVQFDGQKYWIDDNESKGPFCQVCYDRDGLLVHLQKHESHWECLNCKGLYMSSQHEQTNHTIQPSTHTSQEIVTPLYLDQKIG